MYGPIGIFFYTLIGVFAYSYIADVLELRGSDPNNPFDKKVDIVLIIAAAAWPITLALMVFAVLIAGIFAIALANYTVGEKARNFVSRGTGKKKGNRR